MGSRRTGVTDKNVLTIMPPREASMIDTLTEAEVARFNADGFLILPKLIERGEAEAVAGRFEGLFKGKFEPGLYPDEWNWQEGRDRPARTRQICNAWKSDRTVASLVLRRE